MSTHQRPDGAGAPEPDSAQSNPAPAEQDLPTRVYGELRGLARRQMSDERGDHTLQPTALVNEAWMRMRGEVDAVRDNPGLYYHAAAEAMRRILIEHARSRGRQKRGGDLRKLSLDIIHVAETVDLDQVIAMDAAIDGLREVSDRAADLVQLRFFAGLTEAEAAKAMGISERTARREWSFARAWLFKALNDSA